MEGQVPPCLAWRDRSHPVSLGGTGPTLSAETGFTLASFAYTYNAANQRVGRTESDSSYWLYQYDALGQVIAAKK